MHISISSIKHGLRLGIAAFLAAICLSAAASNTFAQGVAPPDLDAARFGLVNANMGPAAADKSGAGWEVIVLRWDELQPGGPEQWITSTEVDEAIIAATRDNRRVVAVLIGTPQWATSGNPETGVPRGLYTPIDSGDNVWAGFVKQVVNYYGNRGVNRWVVWADQDIPIGRRGATWDGSLEDYFTLVKVAYQAAGEINPSAVIHLGGFGTWDQTWFSRLLNSVILYDLTAPNNNYYFDVVTLHHYFSAEVLYDFMRSQFVVMEQAGIPLKEVWVNETNARPAIDPQTYTGDVDFNVHRNITIDQQAAYVIQAYALGFAANRGAHIATYQLVDDLEVDNSEAYGLIREDESRRPAFQAYKLSAALMGNFTFARRLEEDTFPLVDYVRFTFEDRVTHVLWARGETNATVLIPARTEQAMLVDMYGNQWVVRPESGAYLVVVEAASCNDPQAGCLIGGNPWFLVEQGIPNALDGNPEKALVQEGGVVLTPDPEMILTATAQALPTITPSPTSTMTLTPTPEPTAAEVTLTEITESENLPTATQVAAVEDPTATDMVELSENVVTDEPPVSDNVIPVELNESQETSEFAGSILPFLLVSAGILSIGFGVWYYFVGMSRGSGNSRTRKR